jgi:hypothetical protein
MSEVRMTESLSGFAIHLETETKEWRQKLKSGLVHLYVRVSGKLFRVNK